MNHVTIIGRLSSEVELRQTQSGLAVATFSVAVNNGKDKNGQERPADFINCKAWRNTADFVAKWFSKGQMIALEGKFKTDKYTHKKYSDVTIYSSYVLVENVEFCGDKGQRQAAPAQNVVNNAQAAGVPVQAVPDEYTVLLDDEDMPF